jgi:hypothetical protein
VCFWIVLKVSFLNGLSVVDKWLIERKFGGNFGTLLGSAELWFLPPS